MQPAPRTPPNDLQGIPDAPPLDAEALADEANLFARDETEADLALDEALAAAASGRDWLKPARRWLAAGPFLWLLVCGVLLFLLTQSLALAYQLQTLPAIPRALGSGLLLLLIGGALWALLRLIRTIQRLQVSPRLPVETLRQLAERAELRRQANARLQQARTTLQAFLADYPLQEDSDARLLMARFLEPGQTKALISHAQALMDGHQGTSEGWMERFDRQFLGALDSAARRCIRRYAGRVALKTAALPAGFDTAVILLNAYLMARDICVIYNLRTNGAGTAAVLMRVMFNVFAASQMQEITASAADMVFEGGGVAAGVGRAVAARAAEGGVNSLLFMRLGAAMIRHLRPIWPPQKS